MSFGTGHLWLLLILLVVVLIIWGPGKLPDVGAGLGRAIREFRQASQETKDSVSKAVEQPPATTPPAAPPAAPPPPPAAPPSGGDDPNVPRS